MDERDVAAIATMNDGRGGSPYLRRDLNLISVMALPVHSSGYRADQDDMLEMVAAANYVGIQHLHPERMVGSDFPVTGMGRVEAPDDADRIARDHRALGVEATSLNIGTGLETDAEIDRLIGAVIEASARHSYPLYVKTHRGTVTQDIRRTVDIVDRFPDLRFSADLSHWYTGQEMIYGDFERRLDFLSPVFERVRFIHGRIGDSCCVQIDLTGREDADFVQHFRTMWSRCFTGFLERARAGDFIAFAPELLPNLLVYDGVTTPVNYARCFRADDGSFVEEGDRWQQAQRLSRIAEECFAAAAANARPSSAPSHL